MHYNNKKQLIIIHEYLHSRFGYSTHLEGIYFHQSFHSLCYVGEREIESVSWFRCDKFNIFKFAGLFCTSIDIASVRLHRSEVTVKKWPAPIGNQYYHSVMTDFPISQCNNCNKVSSYQHIHTTLNT